MEDKSEIAFSSSFSRLLKEHPKLGALSPGTVREFIQEEIDSEKEEFVKKLETNAINLEKEDRTNEVILAVKRDLVERYKRIGVEISEGDFPQLFFIPDERKAQVESDRIVNGEFKRGSFLGLYDLAIVFLKGDESLLEKASVIHHELEHSVGRLVTGVYGLVEGWVYNSVQMGYFTAGAKLRRGRMLEEGIAEENTYDFVTNSQEEIMKFAREDALKNRKASLVDITESLFNKKSFRENVISHLLHERSATYYLVAKGIVSCLRVGVLLNEGEQGKDFYDELVRGRFEPKLRRKLVQRVDKAFGKGTTRRLFRLGKSYEEAKSFYNEIYEKIPELERKFKSMT